MRLLFIIPFLYACTAAAQIHNKVQLSAGVEAGYVATYDLAVFWGAGIGVSVNAEYPITQKISTSVYCGYNHYIGYSLLNGDKPPAIKLFAARPGLKYTLWKELYLAAQAGIAIAGGGGEIAALPTFNIKGSAFSYSPQIGYTFSINQQKRIDVSVKYESAAYTKTFQTFGCRIAYLF
jgi:hypothetical protein